MLHMREDLETIGGLLKANNHQPAVVKYKDNIPINRVTTVVTRVIEQNSKKRTGKE